MLTQLRFKNWRSLKDVTIDDLQPINVFIGANSAGKTNILDALYFLRWALTNGIRDAYYRYASLYEFRTLTEPKQAVELSFTYSTKIGNKTKLLTYTLSMLDEDLSPSEILKDSENIIWMESEFRKTKVRNADGTISEADSSDLGLSAFGRINTYPEIQHTFQFITQRWQMLDENFSPPLSLPIDSKKNIDLIDPCADNLPTILNAIYKSQPEKYAELQEVAQWLLDHVSQLKVERTDLETRVIVEEKAFKNREAPTISAGTARLLAMLTAYYALDMRLKEMPGLIVIEEPDTALNPGLLGRFVSQLRNYTEGEYPRQFILTTHNPAFLDYFKPEEVRVVERDNQGYTHVKRIPEHIREIWLDEYGLGEVWMTNSLGGIPE
ncbi:MAG: AAA family ATPase [Chloroflexota bacterium]